ncbi:hypothetical protein BU17DRAFT_78559 [Hysterangium stoloniferum]|nr:hypothetical protein BU17DRAFT_78559 [Hysterangium stoloniferum]
MAVLFVSPAHAAPARHAYRHGHSLHAARSTLFSATSSISKSKTPPLPSNSAAYPVLTMHTVSTSIPSASSASPAPDRATGEPSEATPPSHHRRSPIPIPVIVILGAFAPCAFFVLLHYATLFYRRRKTARLRARSNPTWSVVHLLRGSRSNGSTNMDSPNSSLDSPDASLNTKVEGGIGSPNKHDAHADGAGILMGYGSKGRYNWLDSPDLDGDLGTLTTTHSRAYSESRASSYLCNPRLHPLPEYASFSQPSSYSQPLLTPPRLRLQPQPQHQSPSLSPSGCSRSPPLFSYAHAAFRDYNPLSHTRGQAPSQSPARSQISEPQSQLCTPSPLSPPATPTPCTPTSSSSPPATPSDPPFSPHLTSSPRPSRFARHRHRNRNRNLPLDTRSPSTPPPPPPPPPPANNNNSSFSPFLDRSSPNANADADATSTPPPRYVPPSGVPGTPIFGHFRNLSGGIFGLSGWVLNGVVVPVGAMRAGPVGIGGGGV